MQLLFAMRVGRVFYSKLLVAKVVNPQWLLIVLSYFYRGTHGRNREFFPTLLQKNNKHGLQVLSSPDVG